MNALHGFHLRFLRTTALTVRTPSRSVTTISQKREGDISDAFVSLSGGAPVSLEPRFAALKQRLIAGREQAVLESWHRLLKHLRDEVRVLETLKSKAVPQIDFEDVKQGKIGHEFIADYRARGVCVIRNVVGEKDALGWKSQIRDYVAKNPHTKAFPADSPQVYELYWSTAQLLARSHPNLLDTQRFLLSFWHAPGHAPISLKHPVSYADRLRMRTPGDGKFALGPHIDGGSLERWEPVGYGLGGHGKGVYTEIFNGHWERFDPWDAAARVGAVSDLYQGVGACSMFRVNQGWMSMSYIRGGQGHLMVNPMLKGATTYMLLRPFLEAKRPADQLSTEEYLDPTNWRMEKESTALIHGASPGHGQELNATLHPHLSLEDTMVHMPDVRPGDFVAWHCDTIHAVDSVHNGTDDSSVLYIPVCPLTVENARYLARQRDTFLNGTPSPDFGGGEGESQHIGRPTVTDLPALMDEDGIRAMGLMEWNSAAAGLSEGEREILDQANLELGFHL